MKANRAPEKLYIDFRDSAESTWRCAYTEKALANDIEYVRKDAFIEKACEFLDGVLYDYIKLKHANVDTFIDVDNKRFIEDFRNYMERE